MFYKFQIDEDDVSRELSRYFSLSAPKGIIEARRALADAKAVHPDDVGAFEFVPIAPAAPDACVQAKTSSTTRQAGRDARVEASGQLRAGGERGLLSRDVSGDVPKGGPAAG
ncbi:hypothetical protein PPMP20_05030 [Paraburkholderia phymatum]|uniref:Uncharacterized protein n=1 Tax=Paraburkholderia phymatum (strain DSM 17167 / CIP 108236 / LMG 21445 / STM815) TaxID=391038 RepID=B2JCE8_PARP8|nr:hypothetical protein [Paraburkholderia phymatum]ACC70949.1 hypothetical protein Bphy_1767 [Paraburkholderia phymatum STM815]